MEEEKKRKIKIMPVESPDLETVVMSYFWFDENGVLHKIYGKDSIAVIDSQNNTKNVDLSECAKSACRNVSLKINSVRVEHNGTYNYSTLACQYELYANKFATHLFLFNTNNLWQKWLSPLDFLSWCREDIKSESDAKKAFRLNSAKQDISIKINADWREKLRYLTDSTKKNTIAHIAQRLESALVTGAQQNMSLKKDGKQDKEMLFLVLNSALKISRTSCSYSLNYSGNDVFVFIPVHLRSSAIQSSPAEIDINKKYDPPDNSNHKTVIEYMIKIRRLSAEYIFQVMQPHGADGKDDRAEVINVLYEQIRLRETDMTKSEESAKNLEAMVQFLRVDALSFIELQRRIISKGSQIVSLYDLNALAADVREALERGDNARPNNDK